MIRLCIIGLTIMKKITIETVTVNSHGNYNRSNATDKTTSVYTYNIGPDGNEITFRG